MAADCMIFSNKNISQLIQFFRDENLNNDQAGDATWILTSAFLIFTMQSGFGLLEAGEITTFVSKKIFIGLLSKSLPYFRHKSSNRQYLLDT